MPSLNIILLICQNWRPLPLSMCQGEMDTCHGPGCRTLHSVRRRKTSDGDKPSEAGRRKTTDGGEAGRRRTSNAEQKTSEAGQRKTSDGDKPSEAGRRRTSNAGAGRWETEDAGGGCRIETIDAGGGCKRGSGDAGGGCRPKTSDSGRCRRRSEDEPPAPVSGGCCSAGDGEGQGQGARADNPPVQVIQLSIMFLCLTDPEYCQEQARPLSSSHHRHHSKRLRRHKSQPRYPASITDHTSLRCGAFYRSKNLLNITLRSLR